MDHKKANGNPILIVEDEVSLRLTFELFLKRAGYKNVIGVSTAAEAIGVIDQQHLDLIISDIVLEGASGMDILRHAKESGKECPVVMVTGYPTLETASEAAKLGAFDYIPKPVKKDALLQVVGKALTPACESKVRSKALSPLVDKVLAP